MCRGAALALLALVAASFFAGTDARNRIANEKPSASVDADADDAAFDYAFGRSTRPRLSALGGDRHTFEVSNDTFMLDGQPFRIMSGE
jgi:hypothetical protein